MEYMSTPPNQTICRSFRYTHKYIPFRLQVSSFPISCYEKELTKAKYQKFINSWVKKNISPAQSVHARRKLFPLSMGKMCV